MAEEVFKVRWKVRKDLPANYFWWSPWLLSHMCCNVHPGKLYVWLPGKGYVVEVHQLLTSKYSDMDSDRFDPELLEGWCGHYCYVCRCETKTADGDAGVKLAVETWNELLFLAAGWGGGGELGKRAQSCTEWFIISPSQCQIKGGYVSQYKHKKKMPLQLQRQTQVRANLVELK